MRRRPYQLHNRDQANVTPFLALLLATFFLSTACFQTKYWVGPEDESVVNVGYVGKFAGRDNDGDYTLIVRNLDNKRYLAQWKNYGKGLDTMSGMYVVHTTDIRGATFAQLRGLTETGEISDDHAIVRVGLSSDHNTVTVRHLKSSFFKSADSNAALRTTIVENLENSSMYEAPLVMTRVKDTGE